MILKSKFIKSIAYLLLLRNYRFKTLKMSLFGQSSFGQPTNFGGMTSTTPNPMKDVEITNPPDDSISCLRFSPPSVSNASFLVAGSWDNNVRCWQIQQNGQSDPKSQQTMQVSTTRLIENDFL